MLAGYSSTPLKKKLGLKDEFLVQLINVPDAYFEWIETEPKQLKLVIEEKADFIHWFCSGKAGFEKHLLELSREIVANGMIWVSWEKKKSKLDGELNENFIRDLALALGLVDVKVCAVSETWSGLKLVWRVENRGK